MIPIGVNGINALRRLIRDLDLREPFTRNRQDVARERRHRRNSTQRATRTRRDRRLEIALNYQAARNDCCFLREDLREVLRIRDFVEAAARRLRRPLHVDVVLLRAVPRHHDGGDRDFRGNRTVDRRLRWRRGVAIGDDDDVALARARIFERLDRHRDGALEIEHVADDHGSRGRHSLRFVARFLQRMRPRRPIHERDDPDQIESRECFNRGDRNLLCPVVSLRHFAGVHDQDESAAHHLPRGRRIELDRKHRRNVAIDPTTGAETLITAEHEKPAAEVMHVRAKQTIRFAVDRPLGDIREDNRVVPREDIASAAERFWLNDGNFKIALAEDIDERCCGFTIGWINHENDALAIDEGHRSDAIVLEARVLRVVGGLEHRFESTRARAFDGKRKRNRARAGLEIDRESVARAIWIEIDGASTVAEENRTARGALTAQQHAQIERLTGSRARRRFQIFENDFVW